MEGWKTWAGVAGMVIGGVTHAFGLDEAAKIIYSFSLPMVIVGLGSKIDKAAKVLRQVSVGAASVADQLEKKA
jgi:hypothetical protein